MKQWIVWEPSREAKIGMVEAETRKAALVKANEEYIPLEGELGVYELEPGEGPFARGDAWYDAERYGNVGSFEVEGVTHYSIRCCQAKSVQAIKDDPKLMFVSFKLDEPKEG